MDEVKNYTHLTDIARAQESGSQSFLSATPDHLLGHETYHPPGLSKRLTSPQAQLQSTTAASLESIPEPPSENQREVWYNQTEDANLLIYGSNTAKLLESHTDNYLNSRYNVKGIRGEKTSFFDIPAATHPYCYRLTSPTGILKKEPDEGLNAEKIFGHNPPLNLGHHFHHIQYPDSTTSQNNQQTSSGAAAPTVETHYPYHSTYSLRAIDSAIVSSTEPDIAFSGLYANSSTITSNNTLNQRRGSLQLWQFLVALLDEPSTSSGCIAWTGRGMEFKLIEPEEVARRWGIQKNRPAMNYDKLSRSLRYYYEKGIMQKVAGERYVYKFVCDPEALFNMAYGHVNSTESHFVSSCKSTRNSNSLEGHNSDEPSEKQHSLGFYTNCFQSTLK